jgi:hypothetical protein
MKNDQEFTLEMLNDILTNSSLDAMMQTVEAIASELGVSHIQSMSIREFYDRRRRSIAEHTVAELADSNPALASQIKAAWDQVDFLREKQEEDDRRSQE